MATVEQTMMKVQRILTGPMGLRVMLEADRFRITFNESSTFEELMELHPDDLEATDSGPTSTHRPIGFGGES